MSLTPTKTYTDPEGRRYRVGDRIRLVCCTDPYTHLEPGALGTVTGGHVSAVFPMALYVQWDSGSTLSLCPDAGDRWEPEARVVDTAATPPVTSPAGAQTLPQSTLSAPSADDVARASRLWDDAQVQALARRGVEAELVDGRICLTRRAVEHLMLTLPVLPVESAVDARQPSD